MTVSLQNLRAVGVGVEPSSLLPGQIAFNVTDKVIYVGDGSSLKTNFDGTTTGGSPGGGWFAMPMDFDFLNTYFLANPELYGDIPTDGQVVTWSAPLSRPIWTSSGGGGSNQVYQTTNAAVASAPGATLSDKISAAIGVASPDEGNVTLVTGFPGDIYQGLYFFITSWVRGAYYAYPSASNVPYSNILSGLSAITVQQAIDEVDGLVNIAQSTANTAAADAAAAAVIASAALPKAGGTMTGAISFVAGQTFPVSGIQDSTALQKGVVQGGSNMTYTAPGVMDVRAASISQSGVVTLSDSTNLTSSTVAATSTAAKNLQDQIDAISLASNVTLAGTLNAATGLVTSVTTQGTAAGFVSGAPLPAAAVGNADYYVIVDNDGIYNPPGGGGPYTAEVGDWFLSDGTSWQFLGVGNRPAYATTSSAGIIQLSDNPTTQAGSNALLAVTPSSLQSKLSDSVALASSTFIASSAAVKTAYDRGATAETNSIPKITVAAKGTIVTGSAANTPAGLPVGTNNQILIANPSTATGLQWAGDITGFVTGVSGTAPITVNNLNPQTPIVGISAASTLISGAVQLEDSTTSTSTSLALTANQGYSLQQQINALVISNNLTLAGTINGSTGLMATVTAEGTLQGFTVGAAMPSPALGNTEYFTIVTTPGTMTPPGGSAQAVNDGDWWLSNGTVWQYLPIGYSAPYATTTSNGVVQLATDAEVQAGVETTHAVVPSALQSKLSDSISTTSSTTIASSTAVKCAYDLSVPKACYTALGALAAGTGASTVGTLALGTNGQFLAANSGTGTGLEWCTISLACVPCSAFTASGQLLAGTGTSTFTALNVGSNNRILVADSACTGGLKWLTSQGAFLCGYSCTLTPFNTALGANAGDSVTTGTCNTVVGYNAGTALTGGLNNTFIGFSAGDGYTTADNSTAVGSNALGNSGGNNNTAVGFCSGGGISSGGNNTMIGACAGRNATSSDNTTVLGFNALSGTHTGNGTVALGACALAVSTSGGCNTAVGCNAGLATTTGALNTLVGFSAGSAITTGSQNTLVGRYTGTTTLANNVVLSDGAGTIRFQANSNGAWSYDGTNFGTAGQFLISNGTVAAPTWSTVSLACVPCSAFTAAGQLLAGTGTSTFTALTVGTNGQFLLANSACSAGLEWSTVSLACVPCSAFTGSGQLLTGTGTSTFTALPTGTNGQILAVDTACTGGLKWFTSLGATLCGFTCTATPFNTVLGSLAGAALTGLSVCNTAIGYAALDSEASGDFNVAVGHNTLTTQNGATGNTAVGTNAGAALTTGSCNILVGYGAGDALTIGTVNVAIGKDALGTSTGASNSVAVGHCSQANLTTGAQNTTIGSLAGQALTTAVDNVAIGFGALTSTSTSSCNVAVGRGTLSTALSSSNTALGHRAGISVSSGTVTAVGSNALSAVTTGSGNTALGASAGDAITTGSNNTIIGTVSGSAALTNNLILAAGTTIKFQANTSGAWSPDGTNFGTAGQTLQSNGTAAVPTWVTPIWQNLTPLTTTSVGATPLLSVPAATFRGVVINVSVSEDISGLYHTDILQVNHDGTTANLDVTAGAHIGAAPYNASAAISAGNLVVSVTSSSTLATKYVGSYMTFAI